MTRFLLSATFTLAVAGSVNAQTSVSGRWATAATEELAAGPYVLELKEARAVLSGTLRQSGGPQPGPVDIFDGKLSGTRLTFKVKSPDGDRTLTFTGDINGDVMTLKRQVVVRDGGSPGGAGVFGVGGASGLTLRRGGNRGSGAGEGRGTGDGRGTGEGRGGAPRPTTPR